MTKLSGVAGTVDHYVSPRQEKNKPFYEIDLEVSSFELGLGRLRQVSGFVNGVPYVRREDPNLDRLVNYLMNSSDEQFARRKATFPKGQKPLYKINVRVELK